jgi:CheY-like chemotaxis protein
MMVSRVLMKEGYGVKVYGSGETAVAGVPGDSIDAVCLDMSLPGIDGLETLARLKTLQPALPVILFTAAAEEVASRARDLGAYACVAKTGAWAELRAAVAGALIAARRE